ncbi:hypothetical protein H1R20_g6547, partial [Candolleomyces eurysporus]
MFTVETRKFCCCLPVRLGVFILSLLAMVGGSVVAAVGWMSVAQFKVHQVEIVDQIAMYIHSTIFTLLGFLGMLGFVGALARSRGAVISFSIGIAIHLGLSIASGVFTIYSIFKENSAEAVEACMEGKTDDETRKICQTGMGVVKGVIVAVYIIAWLIELYAYFIVDRYADQLEDEELAKVMPVIPRQPFEPYPHQPQMGYNGYPERFSYSVYSRRSYMEPRPAPKEAEEIPPVPTRPRSEYAYTLPQSAYGVSRGKDASDRA